MTINKNLFVGVCIWVVGVLKEIIRDLDVTNKTITGVYGKKLLLNPFIWHYCNEIVKSFDSEGYL